MEYVQRRGKDPPKHYCTDNYGEMFTDLNGS